MPRNETEQEDAPREPRNWSEWREEASQALSELDRALAQARQVIYRLRPMVRPKNEENPERESSHNRRPSQFRRSSSARDEA